MYRETAHLLLYSDLPKDEILIRLGDIIRDWESGSNKDLLVQRCYREVKRLLDLSTACGFDGNLWHC